MQTPETQAQREHSVPPSAQLRQRCGSMPLQSVAAAHSSSPASAACCCGA